MWLFIDVMTGGVNYAKIINPNCSNYSKVPIKTSNVNICLDMEQLPILKINISPEHISYSEFVKEGFLKLRNETSVLQNSTIEAKDIVLTPLNDEVWYKWQCFLIDCLITCNCTYLFVKENKWLSIDNEDYEVKPMKLSLLPNAVYLFKPNNLPNQNQEQTINDQGPKLSLDKFNKHVGLKQFA